jgi:hypothetical protein
LGDLREVAVTQGKIGDMLHGRGDLDEAPIGTSVLTFGGYLSVTYNPKQSWQKQS